MATFSAPTRNTATESNAPKGDSTVTWDQALFTWIQGSGSWNDPFGMSAPDKNVSTTTNPTKN